ncbi:MAG: exosortase A [Pseudomonadota bacterium]
MDRVAPTKSAELAITGPAASTGSGGLHREALLALIVLTALLLLAMHDTVDSLLRLWASDGGYYSYGYLVLPISIALAWQRRRSLHILPPRQEPLAMLALFCAGAVWLVARAADIAIVQQVTLVLSMGLLVLAIFGREIARRLTFPIAFAFLMIPFGSSLVPLLQQVTTVFSDSLLWLVGIPTFRTETVIETSVALFNIAEECAGLQFLAASLAAGVLFAYLAYSSLLSQVLLVVSLVLLSIIVNGVRVAGIIAAVHWSGDLTITGPDHYIYGWILFVIATSISFAIGGRFADWPNRAELAAPSPMPSGSWRRGFLAPLAVCSVIAPAYAATVLEQDAGTRGEASSLASSSLSLPSSCTAADLTDDGWTLQEDGLTRLTATIDCDGRKVDMLLLFDESYGTDDRVFFRAHHWKPKASWRQGTTKLVEIDAAGLPRTIRYHRLVSPGGGQRDVYVWFWMQGNFLSGEMEMLFEGIAGRLLGRPLPFAMVAFSEQHVSASVDRHADLASWLTAHGLDEAISRDLQSF